MVTNIGFDDGHPYVDEGANGGRFVFTGTRVAVTPSGADPVDVLIERSVDGGQTWELVLDNVPPVEGAGVMDFESPVYGEILYRATAFTVEGAAASTTITVMATSEAVWLSAGDGFEQTARLPYDPQPSIAGGRDRVTKQYAGRSLPVTFTGEARSRRVTVKGRTTDRQEMTAAVDRLIDVIQDDAPLHLYRDPDRRRIYGMVTDVTVDRDGATVHEDGWNGIWGYSFVLTEATSE